MNGIRAAFRANVGVGTIKIHFKVKKERGRKPPRVLENVESVLIVEPGYLIVMGYCETGGRLVPLAIYGPGELEEYEHVSCTPLAGEVET